MPTADAAPPPTRPHPPVTDSELPSLVRRNVDRTLELALSWLRWDGAPVVGEEPERIYTPHKCLRRVTDHLIDHLAHLEALAAGAETIPDGWQGSLVTTAADLAPFTEIDLREARQRLRRLAQVYELRLNALGPAEWDAPRGEHWTIRQIVEHVASAWYAEQIGDLGAR